MRVRVCVYVYAYAYLYYMCECVRACGCTRMCVYCMCEQERVRVCTCFLSQRIGGLPLCHLNMCPVTIATYMRDDLPLEVNTSVYDRALTRLRYELQDKPTKRCRARPVR